MRRSGSHVLRRFGAALVPAVLAFATLPSVAASADEAAALHSAEVDRWRAERLESLKQPDSWLTLVGLAWLEEGANTCGSDPGSDVVLPGSAPQRAGAFHVRGGRTVFETSPGADVLFKGQPFERRTLKSDADGEPTVLESGPVSFYVIRRGERLGVRVKDRTSPTYTAFRGLEYFPVSWEWRIEGRFVPYDPPRTVAVPTILGTPEQQVSPGAVVFEVAGKEHRLEAYAGDEANELFLVFGDETNGHETYGGGRFLYARHEAGKAVVDFNKAYSPPCVFTPFATCPLPAPENRLPFAVRAGEKTYGDASH
jgi:hypothetical protein